MTPRADSLHRAADRIHRRIASGRYRGERKLKNARARMARVLLAAQSAWDTEIEAHRSKWQAKVFEQVRGEVAALASSPILGKMAEARAYAEAHPFDLVVSEVTREDLGVPARCAGLPALAFGFVRLDS